MSRLILLCFIGIIFCENWSELSGPYEDSSGTSLVISGQTLSYEGGQCSLWTTDDPNYLGVDPSCGVDYIAISKEQGPVDGIYFGETYYHKSTNVPSWFKQSRGSESDDENVWGNEGWNGYNGYEDDNEYRDQDQYQNEYEDSAPTTTSRVTGKKRALLVGINYKGTSAELGGCINDVKNHKKVLIEKFGFLESDIKMLTEEQDKRNHPTKANIEAGIAWLTKGLQPGDLAVFHYSGHGSQVPDNTGKEKDGKTEVLVPLDFDHGNWENTFISDQFINQNLVRAIPKGVKTVAIFDCCHSGTVSNVNVMRSLDLEDDLDIKPRFLQPPEWMMKIFEQMMEEFLFGHQGQQQGYQQGHQQQQQQQHQQQQQPQKPNQQQQISHTDGAASAGGADPDVEYWSFSGCRDDQTSADASLDGMRQGAFTWGYLKSMQEHNYDVTFSTLHNSIKSKLAGKFQQVPILATTRESRLNAKVMR